MGNEDIIAVVLGMSTIATMAVIASIAYFTLIVIAESKRFASTIKWVRQLIRWHSKPVTKMLKEK